MPSPTKTKNARSLNLANKSLNLASLKPNAGLNTLKEMIQYIHSNVMAMNQSKIFAGIIIIVLNISSKFVTIKLSKPLEGYLKYTFSRDILVFAMAWMGTRDIYTALFMTVVFSICANFLFNEESRLCCLPESFITQHTEAVENPPEQTPITEQQISDAISLLSKVKKERVATSTDGSNDLRISSSVGDTPAFLRNPIDLRSSGFSSSTVLPTTD
jgi:hypothetical protein